MRVSQKKRRKAGTFIAALEFGSGALTAQEVGCDHIGIDRPIAIELLIENDDDAFAVWSLIDVFVAGLSYILFIGAGEQECISGR